MTAKRGTMRLHVPILPNSPSPCQRRVRTYRVRATANVYFMRRGRVILTFRIRGAACITVGVLLRYLHDADLIVLPKWPGLPYIEGVRTPKYFAANDLILRPMVQPWAVFPGADSIHNALLFTDTRDNSAPRLRAIAARGIHLVPRMGYSTTWAAKETQRASWNDGAYTTSSGRAKRG